MRKLFLILGLAALCLNLQARHLTPAEALKRVGNAPSKLMKASPNNIKLVHSIESATPEADASLYLFSNAGGTGYMVLSADDNVMPMLGYSNQGEISSYDAMPDNFKWWLEEMGRQVDFAITKGQKQTPSQSLGAKIEPLVPAVWGQTAPYNLYTPIVSEKQTPTGCVATALCQIMYLHKWPAKPVGSNKYTDSNKVEREIDFSDYTFDWAKMTDTYGDDSSEESRDAVARLMKAVGYGVNMTYGPSGSGANNTNVLRAVKENFGYRNHCSLIHRNAMTANEWDAMVYQQLSAGMPLYYTGRSGQFLTSTGHAFVCDGYDGNGYFHFNWGWNGKYNGYFVLSCLRPEGAGTGGSLDGYTYLQEVLVNFQPDNGAKFDNYVYVEGKDFSFELVSNKLAITLNSNVSVDKGILGIELRPAGETTPTYITLGEMAMDATFDSTLPASWNQSLDAAKKYEVRMVWHPQGEDTWRRVVPTLKSILGLIVTPIPVGGLLSYEGGQWVFANSDVDQPDVTLKVHDINFDDGRILTTGRQMKFNIDVENIRQNDYYMHGLHFYLHPVNSPKDSLLLCNVNIELAPGEKKEYKYNLTLESNKVASGKYFMSMRDVNYKAPAYRNENVVYTVNSLDDVAFNDGYFIYEIGEDGGVTITATVTGSALTGDVTIPATVENNGTTYKVTSVKPDWSKLLNASEITSLNMQYPLESIPSMWLFSCRKLKSLTLGEGVKSIGQSAFYSCVLLEELNLPSTLDSIAQSAFYNCNVLTSVKLPSSLRFIGDMAIYGCKMLKEVDIPDAVTSIGKQAFYNCNALTKLNFGKGIKIIADKAFQSCKLLESLEFPTTLDSLGSEAFSGCVALKTLKIGSGLRKINNRAFYNCNVLTSIEMGDDVETIGDYAFYKCDSLKNLKLSQNLENIGQNAFYSCTLLTEINLGKKVKNIGPSAFSSCKAVNKITIPASVDSIGQAAFSYCSAATSIEIRAENLKKIYPSTFSNCTKCETIKIYEGVKVIGDKAFYYCTGINYIALPASLDSIGAQAFYNMNFSSAPQVMSAAKTPPVLSTNVFSSTVFSKGSLRVLPDSEALYRADTDGWAKFKTIVADPSTSVEGVENDENFVAADVYDITGRLVMRNATKTQINELPQGIYIAGGKKIIR